MARDVEEHQTPRKNFRIPILQALVDAGGWTTRHDVVMRVKTKMTFRPADLKCRPDGAPKWMRVVGYVIGDLRHDGLIEPAARNGVKISDKGREYLSRAMEQPT